MADKSIFNLWGREVELPGRYVLINGVSHKQRKAKSFQGFVSDIVVRHNSGRYDWYGFHHGVPEQEENGRQHPTYCDPSDV